MLPATNRCRPSAEYSSATRRASCAAEHVQLPRDVRLTPLLEARSCRLEGACLDDVAPRVEETAMDPLDDLGRVQHEPVHPSLEPSPTEVIDCRVLELQARSHRAVEDEHAVARAHR